MPIKFSDLSVGTSSATFQFQGESVTVEYRWRLMTPMMKLTLLAGPRRHMKVDADEKVTFEEAFGAWEWYFQTLLDVIVSWDVLDEQGRPLVPTIELLRGFPSDFVDALVSAIVNDVVMDPPKAEKSKGTSKPRASQVRSRIGTG